MQPSADRRQHQVIQNYEYISLRYAGFALLVSLFLLRFFMSLMSLFALFDLLK